MSLRLCVSKQTLTFTLRGGHIQSADLRVKSKMQEGDEKRGHASQVAGNDYSLTYGDDEPTARVEQRGGLEYEEHKDTQKKKKSGVKSEGAEQ